MGKIGLAGMSLAAAIPGGILFVLLLMAVLSSLEPMPTPMKVAAIVLLVLALLIALFPAYILIWYRSSRVVVPGAAMGVSGTSAVPRGAMHEPEDAGEVEDLDDVEEADMDEDLEEFEPHGEELAADDEAFEADANDEEESFEFDDQFEFDEFDEDDKR